MKKKSVLLSLTCLLFSVPVLLSAEATRPNILFIYTDDQSHRTISCYPESQSFCRTPHIDSLAESGIRFKYAYIGTWCMPSRATLLTGHYQHGVESMRMVGKYPGSEYDPKTSPFWPAVFRTNGYQTAQIGKWHTGTDTGHGRDWDHQIVWNRPGYPENSGNYYNDQLIEKNGGNAEMVAGYSTDNYTEWALKYIRGEDRDPEKPWYLWLCFGAVHGPFTPANRHLESYPEVEIPVPEDIYPPRKEKPAYMQAIRSWTKGDDGKPHLVKRRRFLRGTNLFQGQHGSDLNAWVRQYHQGVIAIDEAVGRLVSALRDTGQYDNTLIVFTSDQGYAWGQHGFRSKVAPYDANVRCPLILSMPAKLPTGKVIDTPVGGVDLVPTFFRFAGIDLPWEMHGRDLTPLLLGEVITWERPLLCVHTGEHFGSDTDRIPTNLSTLRDVAGVPWYASLHDGRFKYIRTFERREMEELYDLENDPEELINLALDDDHRDRTKSMREETLGELRRTGAGFVDSLPPVRGE